MKKDERDSSDLYAQKKKDVQHHFMLVGLAAALLGALAAVAGNLERWRKQ